ncbi:Holin-like protein CidA [Acaryochloris thomasi RCC1774]|uniref:Holin-like protein CidA n=1 Tax=Acaryochloris thomasi RCC1774 TaxID=1764569 RepID=A0A2W1JV64_9CYAN|nr:CidA/LrgA family protein [Acaryochloris thomasi]PZD73644.1 Holin-like protein CidA [Acaryochloris thomasi RCC1774]
MDFLNGITILLIYELAGEAIKLLLQLPIPGPVLGMIFLFLTLISQRHVSHSVDLTSKVLLSHLSLLFIPAGVGVMVHFDRITQEWLPISITLLLSTAVTMATTAAIMLGTQRLFSKKVSTDA